MLNNNNEPLESIKTVLQSFESKSLRDASLALLDTLGYQSDKTIPVPGSNPNAFLELLAEHNPDVAINKDKALFNDWEKADVLFQLTDEELAKEATSLKAGPANTQLLQSYLFFAIELNQQDYPRGKLIAIARQLNCVFPMPVIVLIKHGQFLSVAVINRRQSKSDSEKDVLGKATIIRNISLVEPHTGHVQILSSFALKNLPDIHNFDELHAAWEEILNVELLNKKFYKELSNWYFWAINEVSFPGEPTIQSFFKKTGLNDENKLREDIQEHNAKNVIRLLTRFIFVWFIKEKQLIPDELFDLDYLQKEMLKDFSPYHEDGLFKSVDIKSHYYKAILQNLFFATFNQEMGKRTFRRSRQNMNVANLLRYETCFKHPDNFIELAEKYTPFMNGGLFECLDKPHPTKKGPNGGDVIIYEDGFSDRTDNPLKVPDYLFFGHDEDVDLSVQYGSKAKKYKQAAVKGLINIFNSYKFTITENTPIEQDIALDPELLGKVFENLLASYNPETKTTARKQTGSFYTPREIVSFMVDESLIAYLKNEVEGWEVGEEALDAKLHELLSYDDSNPFQSNQSLQKKIIQALDHCKILDPACGSGAFPMGILQKMVHILQKVDPDNTYWQELQMDNAVKETKTVFHLDDKEAREQKLIEINEAFDQKVNDPDYARKLFLIENCIYGVDIQPIATQISKLRFFISLVVDQKVDKNKDNFGIRPLPNLETKFVTANTLIGIEKNGKQMTLDNPEIKEKETKRREVRHRIFSAKTPHTKRKLRDEDKRIREKMGELLIEDGWENKTAKQLSGWNPYDQNATSSFFDPEWMFGVKDGFDVLIGNPPYIGQSGNKEIFRSIKDSPFGAKYHQRRMDYFYFFIHKSLNIAKNEGIITFITTNYFFNATYADKLRAHLLNTSQFCNIVDFNEVRVFESAQGQHNCISILEKTKKIIPCKVTFCRKPEIKNEYELRQVLMHQDDSTYYNIIPSNIIFNADKQIDIKSKVLAGENTIDTPLKILENFPGRISDFFIFNQGVVTGGNKVSKKHLNRFKMNAEKDDGIFVISQTEFDNLNLSKIEKKYIKPWYKNSDVNQYVPNLKNKEYLIYYTSFNTNDFSEVSNLVRHFTPYKELLINRNIRTGDISLGDYGNFVQGRNNVDYVMIKSTFQQGQYFCLSYARNQEIFESPKIVCPQRSYKNTFAYTENSWYGASDLYFLTHPKNNTKELKTLLGILNSKLIYSWLYYKGQRKGEMLQLFKDSLDKIPIINFSSNVNKDSIVILVDIISYLIIKGGSYDIFQNVMDGYVFNLYFSTHMVKKRIDVIQYVEQDIATEMQGRDFGQLLDNEKEIIINQLYHRWAHPDSEVCNRIKLFAVRSPDILKPILESR